MVKGLDQIVVCAGIQTGNTLVDRSPGSDDQDGQARILLANAAQQRQSIAIRQAEVQQDQIVLLSRDGSFSVRNA